MRSEIDNSIFLGLYEKALPDKLEWKERLQQTRSAGYSFMELSIDESDMRIERLKWDKNKIRKLRDLAVDNGTPLLTMCLSVNRRFPFGSGYPDIQKKGMEILESAIRFASLMGIRIVQVAGYDVLMNNEISTEKTKKAFTANLGQGLRLASSLGVMLAIENVDVDFADSIVKTMNFVNEFKSPWLQIYPDLGNLSAMRQNVLEQLKYGRGHIAAVHAKDTLEGVVRRVPYGEGTVDFVSAFRELKSAGFYGPILMEMWADENKDNFEIVKDTRDWILRKISEAGY
jgi:L-ribulose-5-phosphate 3-epimerase